MIESLAVKNFRCFETLELHGLKRINIIVGRNSSGKTALLESIFIAAGGSPEIALRLRALRGLGQLLQMAVDRTSYESLWRDLFSDFDQTRTISVSLVGPPASTRSVTIGYGDQESLTLPFGKQPLDSPFIVPIVFEWRDHKGDLYKAEVKVTKDGLSITGAGETLPVFFFSSGFAVLSNPAENATRFSELSTEGREGTVVEALRQQFPYIRDLSIQISSGVPVLHATVEHFRVKVPVGVLSGGINKLLSILLAVADKPQSVVLVDEIENGFYYDVMPAIWSTLLNSSIERNTQIFASTHSQECLNAALSCISSNEDEFCLIRTESQDGHCVAKIFSGRQLESAIEQHIDVR